MQKTVMLRWANEYVFNLSILMLPKVNQPLALIVTSLNAELMNFSFSCVILRHSSGQGSFSSKKDMGYIKGAN